MAKLYSVRIVNVDYYMTAPIQSLDVMYSDFRSSTIAQVPIIRVFGSLQNGKKICLHVHGVFPYFYIPYDGSENVEVIKYQIATNIDKLVNISFGRASSTCQHVYKITLVSGVPFYGYHSRSHQFFKVFLFNPALIRRVSNLLYTEAILGKLYQPHEAHIPFTLQFMIDYNLHGMSIIILNELKFRADSSASEKSSDYEYLPASVAKISFCELEGDALAENIVNRAELSTAVNPGIAALWEDEKQRKRDKQEDSYIDQCLTLSNTDVAPTKSHLIFKQALAERLAVSQENVRRNDLNISVYPAETPEENSSLDASIVDLHLSTSSDPLNASSNLDLDTTLGDDGNNLLQILEELGEAVELEDDCILTQVEKDEDDDYMDLSMPLEPTTPFKIALEAGHNADGSDNEDDPLDTTLVPQLDGAFDSSSSTSDEDRAGPSKSTVKRLKVTAQVAKYNALPMSVSSKKADKPITESSLGANKNISDDNLAKVKRKLNFVNTSADTTFEEEKVECYLRQYNSECKSTIFERSPNKKQILQEYFSSAQNQLDFTQSDMTHIERSFAFEESSSHFLTQNNDDNSIVESQKSTESSNELKETSDDIVGSLENKMSIIVTPKFVAPTKQSILKSLIDLGIPEIIYERPFYNNIEDFTGTVEVGHSVLKIPSKTTIHLEDFKSTYEGIDSVRKVMMPSNLKWNQETINNLKLSYCEDTSYQVTPLQKPPLRKEVERWLRDKATVEKPKTVSKIEKTKIYIPISPNKMDESDLDMSLTLSPTQATQTSSKYSSSVGLKPESEDVPLEEKHKKESSKNDHLGQITGVTLNNTYGFSVSPENYQEAKAVKEHHHLTILSVELHIRTRSNFKPDPANDCIRAIFYSIIEDSSQIETGIIAVNQIDHNDSNNKISISDAVNANSKVLMVDSENEMLSELVNLIKMFDPEILIGYEIELLSWGYLVDRANAIGINLIPLLSRTKDKGFKNHEDDKALKFIGRVILDGWRLLRHEIALQSYSFESIMYHILHRRVPHYSFKDLTFWWEHKSSLYRYRTVQYYIYRVRGLLEILEQLDLIGRTSELAKLFGIQFFEVLSRGSQFRVESMMLRLAKPLNYIPVSPSVQQRAKMKAPEFLPLILEPQSKFYIDPVIVLDFQSLYPSMIIAYNYCFSTCIGKINRLGSNAPFEFGATELKISKSRVEKLLRDDQLNFSPCGVAFVKSSVRDGIMPRMLREILGTRLMVKKAMKENKGDKVLHKVLHSRQLGLKLIANVTYGYTAANFSGRMPAVELGDSVVSKGRETLQRAITMVEETSEWGAKVVYGDTDSLFVLVPGKSKEDAFKIGQKIADAVTNDNPDPVKLKLEKVYLPCILQTKKRYVGYMYESQEQREPVYEAKGIETVRRDGCPAVAKMLEKCLRLLFETRNVSLIKEYVLRQFYKILTGRVSLQDLTFAKEYRGASGYRPGACVPALELTRKWTAVDKRNEPRSSQRVPYIIANGPPGVPLIKLVRSPRDFLDEPTLRPNSIYYITKVIIPPINRCLSLIGADLFTWFNQMPRKHYSFVSTSSSPGRRFTIAQYFSSTGCVCCGQQAHNNLCLWCSKNPQRSVMILVEKVRFWERTLDSANLICKSCTGIFDDIYCDSLDCPVLYKRNQTLYDGQKSDIIRQVLKEYEF